MSTIESLDPDLALLTDVDRLSECIIRIRNACTKSNDRQPLSFDHAERRTSARIPLKVPVTIGPVMMDDGRMRPAERTIPAETINLSLRGMAFAHAEPLLDERFTVLFAQPGPDPISLLAQLQWTFREVSGGYRSGAQFVGLIDTHEGAPCVS